MTFGAAARARRNTAEKVRAYDAPMSIVSIERVHAPDDEVRALVAELDATLSAAYSAEQRHGLVLDAIFAAHVRFFLARLDGAAVGCGGVALFDGHAEVKRMYVRPAARGRGVADAILARLEQEARAAQRTALHLETGDAQHAALRFYRRRGFVVVTAFGAYASMDSRAVARSVFLSKTLG